MRVGLLAWPARRPLATVTIGAALTVLAALSTARLRPDPSLSSFFPERDPAAVAMNEVLEHFPTVEKLLILVGAPGDSPEPDQLIAYAERLKSRIEADPQARPMVEEVSFRADQASREFVTRVMVPNGLFYLDDAEYAQARQRLTRAAMSEQFRRDEAILAAPGPAASALAAAVVQDPLRLHEFFMDRLTRLQPIATYQNRDALLSSDGRSLLIGITASRPPSDLTFCRRITSRVTALAEEVNQEHLKLEFSGAYPIAARSERGIRADSISSVIGSVACLAVLFLIAFRRPVALLLATFTPLAAGILCGFGLYALLRHTVSPLTAVIGAMLAGIGIDYSIFYNVHYVENRMAGIPPDRSAEQTIQTIGGALVAAWVTSIVGFIAVAFASVRVLHDFSLAGSLGLAGAILSAVFLLPSLLVLVERRGGAPPALRLTLRPLIGWIDRHAVRCLGASIGILVVVGAYLGVVGPILPLETDPSVLHPRPNPPLDAEADIARAMGGATQALIVHLQAGSEEQLLELAHQVTRELASPDARAAGVTSTFSLASLLPDPAIARERISRLEPGLANRVIHDFDGALADSALSPKAYEPYRAFLRRLLTPARPPGITDLLPYRQLAQALLPRNEAGRGGLAHQAILLVFRRPDLQPAGEASVEGLRLLLRPFPEATLTGMGVLSLDAQQVIRHDLPRLIIAAIVIMTAYLLIHFRRFTLAALAVLPSVCSLVCLLGSARFAGAKMNLANIVSIPLLIGIDTDYAIFLVSIARQSATRDELRQRVSASAQAVVLCAAATVLGFGSLAFTSAPAVRSLGVAVAIGVSSCAAATLFLLLPILLLKSDRQPASRVT